MCMAWLDTLDHVKKIKMSLTIITDWGMFFSCLAHSALILLLLLEALILTSRTVLNKMIVKYVQLGAVNLVQSDLGRILTTFLFPGQRRGSCKRLLKRFLMLLSATRLCLAEYDCKHITSPFTMAFYFPYYQTHMETAWFISSTSVATITARGVHGSGKHHGNPMGMGLTIRLMMGMGIGIKPMGMGIAYISRV